MSDVTASTPSTHIIFRGQALLVEGNQIGGNGSTTGIAIVGSDNAGVDVRANLFAGVATGVDLGSGLSGVMVVDNAFREVATSVAGTVPSNGVVQNEVGFGVGIRPMSALHVNGPLTVGPTVSATAGAGQILPHQASPTSVRHTFSTDDTGWYMRFAKNNKGQIVDLVSLKDNGNVGVGVSNPTYRLQLDVDSAAKPGTNTWTIASDAAVKEPASISDFRDGLDVVRQIRPVNYRYNGKAGLPTNEQIGVIAQEVQPAMPYSIERFHAKLEPGDAEETELLGFNSHALQYVLVNAVRELDRRLQALEPHGDATSA